MSLLSSLRDHCSTKIYPTNSNQKSFHGNNFQAKGRHSIINYYSIIIINFKKSEKKNIIASWQSKILGVKTITEDLNVNSSSEPLDQFRTCLKIAED